MPYISHAFSVIKTIANFPTKPYVFKKNPTDNYSP